MLLPEKLSPWQDIWQIAHWSAMVRNLVVKSASWGTNGIFMKIKSIIESVNFIWDIIRQNQLGKETAAKISNFSCQLCCKILSSYLELADVLERVQSSSVVKFKPDYLCLISILLARC